MRPDRVVHTGREPIVPVRGPAGTGSRLLRRHSAGIAAPDPRLWALTLAIIAVDAVWMAASGMAVEPLGFGLAALAVLVLLLAAACLSTVKSDPPKGLSMKLTAVNSSSEVGEPKTAKRRTVVSPVCT